MSWEESRRGRDIRSGGAALEETPTREKLFESARRTLLAEFDRLKSEVAHYGERGAELERVVSTFLTEHLPRRFATTTGFILDDTDRISPHIDVIIYDALNAPLLRYSERSTIVPADNAAVAIEVKSNLTKSEFGDAVAKIAATKALGKSRVSDLDLLAPGAKKVAQRQTLGVLFAYSSGVSVRTVGQWYAEALRDHNNGRHIDFVCILDKGWLDLGVRLPGADHFSPFLTPEPMVRPRGTKGDYTVAVVSHEQPERAILHLLRMLLTHLQFFRTKSYMPHSGLFDVPEETLFGQIVGNMPDAPRGARWYAQLKLIKEVSQHEE